MSENDMILVAATWEERSDVASWLLATADTKGVDRKLIQTRNEGFLVPAELLDDAEVVKVEVTNEEPLVVTATVTTTPAVTLDPRVSVPPDREVVRAWAKEQGLQVGDRGQLKKDLIEAYRQAHS